jgi:gliding motility-associated-like protein
MKRQILNVLLLLCVGVLHGQIVSNFSTNTEGWIVVGDNGGFLQPTHNPTGGNPGGFISSIDQGTNGTWYFAAPTKFIGNKSHFYGENLRFELKQSRTNNQFNDPDLIMEGNNGMILMFNTADNPNTTWTPYTVALTEASGWRVNGTNIILNRRPTAAEFRAVLCNIKRLWIRGEFVDGADEGGLDNVILEGNNCLPNTAIVNRTICSGQTLTFRGKQYKTAGTFKDTVPFCFPQCDSIYTINLNVTQPITRAASATICEGDSVRIGTRFRKTAGTYIDTLKTVGGCDSIITTTLAVKKPATTNQNISICEGDAHKVGDSTYTTAGTYRTILRGVSVCDSTIVTNLTVNKKAIKNIDTTVCAGKGVFVNGNIYTKAGIYRDTFRRRPPLCDSLVTLTIKYSPLPEITENIVLCKNDSTYVRGRLFGKTGTFRDTLKNYNSGCDTIIVTNVTTSNLSVQLGADVSLEKGDSLKLDPNVAGGNNLKWTWTPPRGLSCTNCKNPIARPDKSVTYIVEVRDTVGKCVVKDDISVTVKACDKIFFPDAFSPNNDGNNDVFIPFGAACAKSIKQMAIFSRTGHLIYTVNNVPLNDPKNGWDGTFKGKDLPNDVYVYLVEIEYGNGEVKTFSGDLTLIK